MGNLLPLSDELTEELHCSELPHPALISQESQREQLGLRPQAVGLALRNQPSPSCRLPCGPRPRSSQEAVSPRQSLDARSTAEECGYSLQSLCLWSSPLNFFIFLQGLHPWRDGGRMGVPSCGWLAEQCAFHLVSCKLEVLQGVQTGDPKLPTLPRL